MGIGLFLVDHHPDVAGRPWVWKTVGGAACALRWYGLEAPVEAEKWAQQIHDLTIGPLTRPLVNLAHLARREMAIRRGPSPTLANAGPGRRKLNSLLVAVAVDAHLGGAPATALDWATNDDPVTTVGLDTALSLEQGTEIAATEPEARRIAAAWGPGAKGVASIRVPGSAWHRVINVVCDADEVTFLDYFNRGADPRRSALELLESVDERSAFASIHLGRTADRADALGIPDRLHQLSASEFRTVLSAVVPATMPIHLLDSLLDRCWAMADSSYTRWLVRQVQLGAATLVGGQYEQPETVQPLTLIDDALITFMTRGRTVMRGDVAEVLVPDTAEHRQLAEVFVGARLRESHVDGVPCGHFEICIDHHARQQIRNPHPTYAPPRSSGPSPAHRTDASRAWSWIDTNRPSSPGSRRTNCWNTAATIANYLSTGAVASSLPIYEDEPFRPTIPQFLALVGAAGPAQFVDDRESAAAVVRGWGAGRHGLVAAALNEFSTHMFNVYFDGWTVRFIDGHHGLEGDNNFETRWQRIGVIEVGAMAPQWLVPGLISGWANQPR